MMKKMYKVAAIIAVLLVAFSSFALAADIKVADINYGEKADDNHNWGFVWTRNSENVEAESWGFIQPYMKIYNRENRSWGNRFNKRINGAYVSDSKQFTTTIVGARLGVNYSDYVAKFHGDGRQIGVRIYPYKLDFGAINFDLDATAVVGAYSNEPVFEFKPQIEPNKIGLLFGLSGKVFDADVKAALARYYNGDKEVEKNFYNYSVEAEMEVIPGLTVKGLYAGYSEDKDYLYEVTADYNILPDFVSLRAGHRNSVFNKPDGNEGGTYDKKSVLGGSTDNRNAYVDNKDPIKDLYNRGNSINVGATVWYDFDIVENELKVDFDTTNPKVRKDFDDKISVALDTKVLNFGLKNTFTVLVPDEDTDERDKDVFDASKNRLDYGVKFTAKYDIPVPVFNSLTATGKVNFDWDNNYVEDNRTHTIVGLELASSVDILKAKNVGFGAIAFYDMPSNTGLIEDAFKYALLAKYDAPNGVRFRLEYNSSVDFKTEDVHVHQDKLNDRYADFRHYDNSKFDGIRFAIGFPI